MDWTLEGVSYADAGVAFIQIDIPNEVLSPNEFNCQEASLGANLGVYYAGDYQLTVVGLDASREVTHQVTQTLRVVGGKKNSFAVDVPRVVSLQDQQLAIGGPYPRTFMFDRSGKSVDSVGNAVPATVVTFGNRGGKSAVKISDDGKASTVAP